MIAEMIIPKRFRYLSPSQQAKELLDWLRAHPNEFAGQMITHKHILEYYERFCLERGVHYRSWNPIAKEFSLLTTGGRKVYASFSVDGAPRRLRIYPIW